MQHSLNRFPPKSIDIVPTTTETTRGYQIEWYKIVSHNQLQQQQQQQQRTCRNRNA